MFVTIQTKSWWGKILHFVFGPIDPIRLEFFRVFLGISLFVYFGARWVYAEEWLTESGFHVLPQHSMISDLWVPLLPAALLPIFGFIFLGSIVLFTLGWQLRIVNWVVFFCVLYVTLADEHAAFTLNKVFVISLLVLALSCPEERAPSAWPLRILQALLIMLFFFPGISKAVYGEWLQNPHVLWGAAQGTFRNEFADFLLSRLPQAGWVLMQYSALAFELLSPVLFGFKRLRWIGFLWGGVFQVMIALSMRSIFFFNLQVFSFFVLFVDENKLYAVRNKIRRRLCLKIKL